MDKIKIQVILFSTMKKLFLALLLCAGWAVKMSAVEAKPTAREVLERTLECLKGVHTARYVMEQYRYETPADSFYSDKETRIYIECENPADTSGLAMLVTYYPDGKFQSASNEKASYYMRDAYMSRTDLSRWYGVRYADPPFFNHATRLCEYLLRDGGNKEVTVKDGGDTWIIDAVVSEYQLIAFHGKAYVVMSYPNEKSLFTLTVDKNTFMPSRLSFLWCVPVMRFEKVISDVEINPLPAEGFAIETYLPDLPSYEDEEERQEGRRQDKLNRQRVESKPLPSDTLQLIGGGSISLSESKGKVRVMLLTSNYCGFCLASYPVINKLMDDYASDDDVEVFGVILQSEAEPAALEAYKRKNDIRFPLAQNNGRFYEYFIPNGLSPAILVIDRDDKVQLWQYGFSEENSSKIDGKIRKLITRLKTEEQE